MIEYTNRKLRKYLNKQKDINLPFCICGKPMIKRTNRKTIKELKELIFKIKEGEMIC